MFVTQGPHILIGKAKHNAKEPKVAEELEYARRKTRGGL